MVCNFCNSGNLVPIWYGYPGFEQLAKARKDEIVLGGYPAKEFTHFCLDCNTTYPVSQD